MKIVTVILGLLCIAAALGSSGNCTGAVGLSGSYAEAIQIEKKIHRIVNEERKKRGLRPLVWDEGLHRIARRHSRDMKERDYFSHDDPEGRSFTDRYRAAGFECRIRVGSTICTGGENILQVSWGNSSLLKDGKLFLDTATEEKIAESVVKRWMASRTHRGNILTPYFRREGIGVAVSEDGRVYVTEDFC
jgi:uncharacterized protein YkwD